METSIRLSAKERVFLANGALSAELSVKGLAKKTGLSESAVRYTRDSLLERDIIKPVYHIDLFALGYVDFTAFVSRGAESSVGRRRFEQTLINHPRVTGLSKMGGAYQYMVWLQAKEVYEIEDLFATIRPAEPGAHFEKTVRIALEWAIYTPNFLAPDSSRRVCHKASARTNRVVIDDTDASVLAGIAKYPSLSLASIARKIHVNPNTFLYRFDKLRECNVVRGLTYILQTDLLGLQTYRVLILDRGMSGEQRTTFRKRCEACPHVVAFVSCTGNWDYELRFETESSKALDRFCQDLYDEFGSSINTITTIQQHQSLKRVAFPTSS